MREANNIVLLRETTEEERKKNHGRLPSRFWLVLFPSAGAAKPYAIVGEWDDGRPLEEEGFGEITDETLQFWIDTQRRLGDW